MAPICPSIAASAPTPSNPARPQSTSSYITADEPTAADSKAPPPSTETEESSKKRKRKEKPHILHTSTFRKPLWTYFHLRLAVPVLLPPSDTPTTTTSLDALTARSLLTPPLQTFLGLHGSSIPIDILKTHSLDIWIRLERESGKVLRAALSGWTGSCDAEMVPGCEGRGDKWGRVKVAWRVVGSADALGLLGGDGSDLFGD